MGQDPSLTSSDKRLVHSLLLALEPLSTLRGGDDTVPFRLVITFLTVALDEGRCANEYAQVLGVHRYAMSRYVHELADRDRNGRPGLGLIRVVFEKGGRNNRHNIFLSATGRAVAAKVLCNLRPLSASEAA
jgi:hypothetical protein